MIRIAIVNDVPMAMEVLRRIVVSLPDAQLAWTAINGQEAVDKCQRDTPDVVLMDLIMPVMDGVEATRRIMKESPCPILVVTATVSGNCGKVYESLGHGALDAVNTPVLGRDGGIAGGDELKRKIRNIVRLRCAGNASMLESHPGSTDATRAPASATPLLAIGASTGGPQAVARVLGGLKPPIQYSIVVVQHLDTHFIPGFVGWLADETRIPVQQVEPGSPPSPGRVSVPCTRDHFVVNPDGVFQYVEQPAQQIHRPSVDVLFDSLARAPLPSGVAVLLTGMGRDGAAGLKALKDSGWRTFAQDQVSSIVWGMPGAAVKLGAADRVLPLGEIGPAISEIFAPRGV